jgi:hypothetical protein
MKTLKHGALESGQSRASIAAVGYLLRSACILPVFLCAYKAWVPSVQKPEYTMGAASFRQRTTIAKWGSPSGHADTDLANEAVHGCDA